MGMIDLNDLTGREVYDASIKIIEEELAALASAKERSQDKRTKQELAEASAVLTFVYYRFLNHFECYE